MCTISASSTDTWLRLVTHETGDSRGCERSDENCTRQAWAWLDNSSLSYTDWYPGELTGDSACGKMLSSGLWGDISCSVPHHSICEKPVSPLQSTVSVVVTTTQQTLTSHAADDSASHLGKDVSIHQTPNDHHTDSITPGL